MLRVTLSPSVFFTYLHPPPTSPLFPYTTLFRSQIAQEPPRVTLMLEPDDEVIGEPHDDHITARMPAPPPLGPQVRSEEHTSELQSQFHLVCRLLLEKKKKKKKKNDL